MSILDVLLIFGAIAEVLITCAGVFVWLRTCPTQYSMPTAFTLGIISGLGIISLLFQVGFLIRWPEFSLLLELVVVGASSRLIASKWSYLNELCKTIFAVWRETPVLLSVMAIACTYLLLQALLLPPSSWDALTYHLPRVLLWEQNRSLLLREFSLSPQATFPVGSDILFHLFLRIGSDYGLGLFSWLSYLSIMVGTYAIARPRTTHTIALTTSILIAALPEVVYQSTATKNDIILAAVALACVIWADQWLRATSIESLLGLGLTLCFGISVKTTFVLFAFFFLIVWLSLVIQRGYQWNLITVLIKHWPLVVCTLLPALVLSQSWLFLDNYQQFGRFLGPEYFVEINRNNDGLMGGLANATRYSFQSVHLLYPVDKLWEILAGISITSALQSIYEKTFDPLFGELGRSQIDRWMPFELRWRTHENMSWFGPFSTFLIVPATMWCLIWEKELPRRMAIVTLCVFLAISYMVGWSPWKSRFFTLIYGLSGLCVAAFLYHLRCQSLVKDRLLQGLRVTSIMILGYACIYNLEKPLAYQFQQYNPYWPEENREDIIWTLSDWTTDRLVYERLNSGARLERMSESIPSGQTVAIVGYDSYFSLMAHNRDLRFVLLSTERNSSEEYNLGPVELTLARVDYVMCLGRPCDQDGLSVDLQSIWKLNSNETFTELYQVFY
ncbi:MAG: glycosyltransferase family 39 protein [Cyanobacteria bacterium J06627_8]